MSSKIYLFRSRYSCS